jgi:hypothetical protein
MIVHRGLVRVWCKRCPTVIGKLQGVDDIPAERRSCQSRDGECLHYLIAHEEAPFGLWRKGGGKSLGALLFRTDVGPQEPFVSATSLFVRSARLGELARQP